MSIASPCTCFRLRRTTRQATQIYDHELQRAGLSLNQYSILRRTREQPLRLGELAELLDMDRTTLSRNLKPLLEAGWLEETRGEDARQRLVGLSSAGRRQVERARPHWQRAQLRLQQLYGDAATRQLHRQLDALSDALRHAGTA